MGWLENIDHIEDIELGKPTYSGGHETYLDAVYISHDSKSEPAKVVFKRNKYGKANLSRYEVSFSKLARLFLAKGTTASQRLVINNSLKVVGLNTEHLCYVIEQKEGLNKTYYTFTDPKQNCNYSAKPVSQAEDIPYYFFDKLPQGFFAELIKAEKAKNLTIDYTSLASILASSYTLEEDDLHKGNFGFYLIEKDGKPHAVFFKIDHDLMFADSIMSFKSPRPFHIHHGANAFDITAEDLLHFPFLSSSSNYFWPTKLGFISKPWENKEYRSFKEVEAFTLLGENPEFKKAKWLAFYKHILIPRDLIEQVFKECLNEQIPSERAKIALFTQATIARQARLKAVLFSTKEFRQFVATLKPEEYISLVHELMESSPKEKTPEEITNSISSFHILCQTEQHFDEEDTPLHIAIKLGEYRYEETIEMFGRYINQKNKAGKTPLDVAMDMLERSKENSTDIRKDVRFTIKHLLENGAEQNQRFEEFNRQEHIEVYQFSTPYLNLVTKAKSYQEFKNILRDIGEDHTFCLKSKKNLAIDCLNTFIKTNEKHPNMQAILTQLKKDINGESGKNESSGLMYIRQLRSRLWIIRLIRGLYGQTSTQTELNSLIDNELARVKKEPNCFSFFSPPDEPEAKDVNGPAFNLN